MNPVPNTKRLLMDLDIHFRIAVYLRNGVMVSISGSHSGNPGSIPGYGISFFHLDFWCFSPQETCQML